MTRYLAAVLLFVLSVLTMKMYILYNKWNLIEIGDEEAGLQDRGYYKLDKLMRGST
jgi:hypothetical protein